MACIPSQTRFSAIVYPTIALISKEKKEKKKPLSRRCLQWHCWTLLCVLAQPLLSSAGLCISSPLLRLVLLVYVAFGSTVSLNCTLPSLHFTLHSVNQHHFPFFSCSPSSYVVWPKGRFCTSSLPRISSQNSVTLWKLCFVAMVSPPDSLCRSTSPKTVMHSETFH